MRPLAFLPVLLVCCSAPAPPSAEPLAVLEVPSAVRADGLGAAFAALTADSGSVQGQQAYFNAFPEDFASMKRAFGFEEFGPDSVVFGDQYEQADAMIAAFFRLDRVPAGEVAKKAIGIAHEGTWQEDGVDHFRHQLAERFELEPEVFLGIIRSMPSPDQIGFWRFYLEGADGYPAKQEVGGSRTVLMNEPRQLAIVDSLLALPRHTH